MADKRLKTLNPAASVSALADRPAELAADTSLILVGPVFAPAGGEWGRSFAFADREHGASAVFVDMIAKAPLPFKRAMLIAAL
jgi:hypothetical protein